MGLRANNTSIYGTYYYLGAFTYAVKHGIWTTNYKQRNLLKNNISDTNGKYHNGGIIRYAIFLKNNKYILYRKNNPFYTYINNLDTTDIIDMSKQKKNVKTIKSNWAEKYNSLSISSIKYKHLSGYFNINSQYIIRNLNQQKPLSCHELDVKNVGNVYDPLFKNYNIL